MSQHHISTEEYVVVVGWDRPLRQFFGTVWNKAKLDNEHVVFTTLDLPDGGVETVEEITTVLKPFVELPGAILRALMEDQALNRGNAVRQWNSERSIKETGRNLPCSKNAVVDQTSLSPGL